MGRTLVILTMAAWLAALTPASAAPGPADSDAIRTGIGIGGELIDVRGLDDYESYDHEDSDDDGDGNFLFDLLFGDDEEDANAALAVVEVLEELELGDLLELEDIEPVEDILDLVEEGVDFVLVRVGEPTVCQVRHFVSSFGFFGPPPTCLP